MPLLPETVWRSPDNTGETMVVINQGTKMIHRAGVSILTGLAIGLALTLLPGISRAQQFEPGTPVAEAWEAYVEAKEEDCPLVAVQRIDRVIALVEGRYARESAIMATVLGLRANALQRVGRLHEAETAARESLDITRRVSGPNSVQAMDATNTLAVIFLTYRGEGPEQQRPYVEEARRLLEQAIASPAGSNPARATAREALRISLSSAYSVLGRQDDAIALLTQIVAALTSPGQPNDALLQSATINLAQAYISATRYDEAEAVLERLIWDLTVAGDRARPALADALFAYAFVAPSPERREASLRQAAAIQLSMVCRDPEGQQAGVIAPDESGFPSSSGDPECPGNFRLAGRIAGFRGLAYGERVKDPPLYYASTRMLALASDMVSCNTRLNFARDPQARAAFGRLRFVHREFVTSAWEATEPQ